MDQAHFGLGRDVWAPMFFLRHHLLPSSSLHLHPLHSSSAKAAGLTVTDSDITPHSEMFQLTRIGSSASRSPSQLSRTTLLQLSFSSSSTDCTETDNVDRPGPPPIRVALTSSAGRGVLATRRIGTGDLIHTAKPVVSYPSMSAIHSVCYFCLRKLERSGAAQAVAFCSAECAQHSKAFYEVHARADWSAFDDYCWTQDLKYPLLVKRLACMVIAGSASTDCLDILQPAFLSTEMISEMEKGFNLLRSAFEKANLVDEQISFLNKQWYISLLARIRINAFRIELAGGSYEDLLSLAAASVESEVAVGNSVYLLPSFYNHDCDPNAHIIWLDNAFARMKALRDIEPGEELRICYIDASLDHNARQAVLSQGFGFHCSCPRCLSGD